MRDTLLMHTPELTPSIIATIPDLVKELLLVTKQHTPARILLSSNGLANRFILTRWGIRPSQRRRNKNLFAQVRKECRKYFRFLLSTERIICEKKGKSTAFGVFKFDEVRGNLILGFTATEKHPFL